MPSGGKQMLNGKAYYNTTLSTRSYPVFLFLYDLFYLNGVKIVSPEIFQFFTPVSLAY
jgi:ATP-dependent DNA ligase